MGSIGPVSLRAVLVPTVLLLLPLAACGQQPAANPGVLAADPWVRTTDGAKMPEMTAVFVNLTNPGTEDRTLVAADCGDVAGATEVTIDCAAAGDAASRNKRGAMRRIGARVSSAFRTWR